MCHVIQGTKPWQLIIQSIIPHYDVIWCFLVWVNRTGLGTSIPCFCKYDISPTSCCTHTKSCITTLYFYHITECLTLLIHIFWTHHPVVTERGYRTRAMYFENISSFFHITTISAESKVQSKIIAIVVTSRRVITHLFLDNISEKKCWPAGRFFQLCLETPCNGSAHKREGWCGHVVNCYRLWCKANQRPHCEYTLEQLLLDCYDFFLSLDF